MPKYLIEDGNTLYTVSGGSLVTVSGSLSAATFQSDGFDDVADAEDVILSLTAPTLYAWADIGAVSLTGDLTALPQPQSIVTNEVNLIASSIIGVSNITATYTGNPLIAVSIDSGSWLCYDDVNEQWVTTSDGMSIADAQTITDEVWADLFNGASTFRVRITLSSASDSLTQLQFTFTAN